AVEALFFAALEKGTAAERAAYLDAACRGDAELRRQVQKLLRAHPKVGDFLSKPAAERLAAAEPPDATQEFDASTGGQSAGPARRAAMGPPRREPTAGRKQPRRRRCVGAFRGRPAGSGAGEGGHRSLEGTEPRLRWPGPAHRRERGGDGTRVRDGTRQRHLAS